MVEVTNRPKLISYRVTVVYRTTGKSISTESLPGVASLLGRGELNLKHFSLVFRVTVNTYCF
ncbi:hypothetical protein WA026_011827, partial [Henosepilachna vigintioctopunctata]